MTETGRPVRLLVGHSFGGSAAIAAACAAEDVRAVVSIGAPFQPAHVEHKYDALVQRIMDEGEAPFLIGGKALTLRRHFIEDVRATDLQAQIRQLRRAPTGDAFPNRQHGRHHQRQPSLPRRTSPGQLRIP